MRERNMQKREKFHIPEFGENVWFFAPEDDPEAVQAALDELYRVQEANQFGEERCAVYFFPGSYREGLSVNVGFYTQVAGLGVSPKEVSLPSLQCTARWNTRPGNNNACCNFWRGVENLTLESDTMWAVSQATYLRRLYVKKDLYLHDEGGWASGGFSADVLVDGMVDSGTQQQWLARNCDWDTWKGYNWNMVFAGIAEGKAPLKTWPEEPNTAVENVEWMKEKPFLVYQEQGFGVYVPGVRKNGKSVSWRDDKDTMAEVIPMECFYIARADVDNADSLNRALEEGKHLFFTPGNYELEKELVVSHDNAVILGCGLATLLAKSGNICMRVTGAGTIVAGLLFDAGEQASETLLLVERLPDKSGEKESTSAEAADNSTTTWLMDLFFRVGGAAEHETRAKSCLIINRDNCVGDNFWIWRADHGKCVGWESNPSANGIIVNGDYVTIYALMVEHFEEYQTVWNGEYGKVIMYQCEIPYDVPAKEVWMSHEGTQQGYASYYVAPHVKHHEAWGLGVYTVNRLTEAMLHCVMDIPETPEVKVHNVCAIMITGYKGIRHVINNSGKSCTHDGERQIITQWPL